MNPGQAVMFKDPGGSQVLTFVGEVEQGALTVGLPSGTLSPRSSIVPQQGHLTADLGAPPDDGDQVYTWGNPNWNTDTYDAIAGDWGSTPGGPVINVGQGFIYKKAGTTTSWLRNFTVQ